MAKFFSKIKRRTKLAYRTPDWFKRQRKYSASLKPKAKYKHQPTTKP